MEGDHNPGHEKSNRLISYLKDKSPLIFRLKGSVLAKIYPQILFGLAHSIVVLCIHGWVVSIPEFPTSFITVLGLVIGLLLVFRTSTGYDRYWEGRKLWSTLTFRIRMMSYSVWLGIKESPESRSKDFVDKRSAINLLLAFAYATKNYLREEYSHDADEDIKALVPHLARITQQQEQVDKDSGNTKVDTNPKDVTGLKRMFTIRSKTLKHKQCQKHPKEHLTMSTRRRLAAQKKNCASSASTQSHDRDSEYHAYDAVTPTNIPLELVCHFLSYLYKVTDEKKIDVETGKILLNSANELTNCLTQLERILRTPIPLAYSIHLHQCIWLYILFLPYQVVAKIGWLTIPGMGLACTYLLGILAIGWEIENPFGYDDNDLPLDDFCDVVREEVERLIEGPFPCPESWLNSPKNHPFDPDSPLCGEELGQLPFQELQKTVFVEVNGKSNSNHKIAEEVLSSHLETGMAKADCKQDNVIEIGEDKPSDLNLDQEVEMEKDARVNFAFQSEEGQ